MNEPRASLPKSEDDRVRLNATEEEEAEEPALAPAAKKSLTASIVERSHARLPPHSDSKLAEWLALVRSRRRLSMRTLFRFFGRFLGNWPLPCLLAAIIILSVAVFSVKIDLRDRVRDGYTPKSSRARLESNAFREFYGSTGDPAMTTVILKSRDGSSMIDDGNLREAVNILQHVKQNITVQLADENGRLDRTLTYSEFCGHYCSANDVVDYFYLAISEKRRKPWASPSTNLSYPIAKMDLFDFPLERNFNGVRVGTKNGNITNIDHCELVIFTFTSDVGSVLEEQMVARWELAVFDYAAERPVEGTLVEMLVMGAEIVDHEINKDSQKMTPYFVFGFVVALVFTLLSGWTSLFLFNRLSTRNGICSLLWHFVVPFFACLVPIFAIIATFGLFGLLGLRVNSLMLIMPFLIMGIGVNDSFLVANHWLMTSTRLPRMEVMAEVFEEVGPSITMTTLTNVISFAIGSYSETEEIALFCMGSAIAMGLCYVFTLLFFGSMLALTSPISGEKPTPMGKYQRKIRTLCSCALQKYTRLLTWWPFRVLCLVVFAVYLFWGIRGSLFITSRLDTEKILPRDTPIRRPNLILERVVWKEYYPVYVMVNTPFDIGNRDQVASFYRMVEDFEKIPKCRGARFTTLWLREYEKYFNFTAALGDFDMFSDDEKDLKPGEYTYEVLDGFLASPLTKHFNAFLHYKKPMAPPIRAFSFIVVYENNTSWDDRIELQLAWRGVVDRYPTLNATIWNVNGMFVDQMLSLKGVAIQSGLLTLGCMAVVCLAFIQKVVSVVIATSAIASIAFGTVGYLGLWELDMDPVTICAILIAIGMSVDNTAHISLYYANTPRGVDGRRPGPLARLTFSIGSVFYPALQGNISTLICVAPLILLKNYIPLVFVKTILLVVIWGSVHGLLIIPMLLSIVPNNALDFDILAHVTGASSSDDLRKAEAVDDDVMIGSLRKREEESCCDGPGLNTAATTPSSDQTTLLLPQA